MKEGDTCIYIFTSIGSIVGEETNTYTRHKSRWLANDIKNLKNENIQTEKSNSLIF